MLALSRSLNKFANISFCHSLSLNMFAIMSFYFCQDDLAERDPESVKARAVVKFEALEKPVRSYAQSDSVSPCLNLFFCSLVFLKLLLFKKTHSASFRKFELVTWLKRLNPFSLSLFFFFFKSSSSLSSISLVAARRRMRSQANRLALLDKMIVRCQMH